MVISNKWKHKLNNCCKHTSYFSLFMLFSLLTIALICVTTFFLIVLDTSLGNEPVMQKNRTGYQNSNYYRVMKRAKCTVKDPCVPSGTKGYCRAELSYTTFDRATHIAETKDAFPVDSEFAKYQIDNQVECYVDPYREDLVNYEPVTNANPKFLTITLGLVGGSIGIVLITLALALTITCLCARRKSKFTDDDLDRLMAHVNQDDIGPL